MLSCQSSTVDRKLDPRRRSASEESRTPDKSGLPDSSGRMLTRASRPLSARALRAASGWVRHFRPHVRSKLRHARSSSRRDCPKEVTLGFRLAPLTNPRSAENRSPKATFWLRPKMEPLWSPLDRSRAASASITVALPHPSLVTIARKRAIDAVKTRSEDQDAPKSAFGFTQALRDHRSTCHHVYGPGCSRPPLAQLGAA